jgi:hypothetical protein
MARQDSYYPYKPNYTTEVGMVYNPIDMSQANEMVGRQLDQRTQMYQQNLDAVAAAENEMATQKIRGVDRPGINARLEKFTKNIDDVVKDRYQGDYAMARKDILRNIAKERGEVTRATQLYDIEQQYAPVIKQLQAQGKYLGNDAMNQAAYDKDGNFIAAPSYDFREQSDYLKLADPLVEKVSKQVKDIAAQPNNYGYIEQKIAQGQAALTEPELDKLVDEYLPTFKANSTFDIDEKIKGQYGGDARNYLKDIVKSTALSATKSEWHQNWLQKEAIDRAAKIKPLGKIFTPEILTRATKNDLLAGKSSFQELLSTPGKLLGTSTYYNNIDDYKKGIEEKISELEKNIKDPLYQAMTQGSGVWEQKEVDEFKKGITPEAIQEAKDKVKVIRKALSKQGIEGVDKLNDLDVFKLADQQQELLTDVISSSQTIADDKLAENINISVLNNAADIPFYDDLHKTVSTNIKDVLKGDDTTVATFKKYIKDKNIRPSYDSRTGKFSYEVPKELDKNGDPKGNATRKLYFSPNKFQDGVIDGLKRFEKAIINNNDKSEDLYISGTNDAYIYMPQLNGPAEELNSPLNSKVIVKIPVDVLTKIPRNQINEWVKTNYQNYPALNQLDFRGEMRNITEQYLDQAYNK